MGLKDAIKKPLVHKLHKEYERDLEASLDTFKAFMARGKAEWDEEWSAMSADTRKAIDKLREDLLFIKITPGKMTDGAEWIFAYYFYDNPRAVLAYCDEYWMENDDVRTGFKPDWSPDTFLNRFYFDGLVVVRKSVFEKEVPGWDKITGKDLWWHTIKQFLEIKGGFNKMNCSKNAVIHIPTVLYKRDSLEVEAAALGQDVNKDNKTHVIENADNEKPSGVTVIIPSKDHPELLKKCILSLRKTVDSLRLQIIVVDNGSSDFNRAQLESYSETMDFKYIYREMPFNFSRMCNIGASEAIEEQLLFLNDDIECVYNGWLEDMACVAARPYVGAVGSKLLYPDGKRIQHAGIVNLPIGPAHKLQFLDDEVTYYDRYNRGIRNVVAITGACLLIRREVYEEAGGMSEELAVAFNDVELCFRLYEKGYYQVVLQDKPLYHHESLSRGDDESTEKWLRLMKERTVLYALHPGLEGADPFYNPNLNSKGLDVHILPEYMQGGQQMVCATPVVFKGGLPDDAREDNCLMVRAEICRELSDDNNRIELYGYGVVLGSDNSLFAKELLLRKEDGTIYILSGEGAGIKRQYRADLVRNMPDQKNVAMSGFWINFDKSLLPGGRYEVGMYAADKTSRTKLFSFTGRVIVV